MSMNLSDAIGLINNLGGMSAFTQPEKMFYCKIPQEDNKFCWGFLSPYDTERLAQCPVTVEVDIPTHQALIAGGTIVYYNGELFNAPEDRYLLDENFDFYKRPDEEYYNEKATKKVFELVDKLYTMKASKAYGGVVINNSIVFETNQTSITNTVANLALLDNADVSNWKFYTVDGVPTMQKVNKTQLWAIANFGRKMIDEAFKVEGDNLTLLKSATNENLNSDEWVNNFISKAQADFDNVENHITVDFT